MVQIAHYMKELIYSNNKKIKKIYNNKKIILIYE